MKYLARAFFLLVVIFAVIADMVMEPTFTLLVLRLVLDGLYIITGAVLVALLVDHIGDRTFDITDEEDHEL